MKDENQIRDAFYGKDPLAGEDALRYFLNTYGGDSISRVLPLEALPGHSSIQVEIRLAKLASEIGAGAAKHLCKILVEGSWDHKLIAAPAFGGLIGLPEAERDLLEVLEANDEIDTMRLAIESLGYLGAHRWAFHLVEFAKSGDWKAYEEPWEVNKYIFDKLVYYVLQALIRMTRGTTDSEVIARCLSDVDNLLELCDQQFGKSRTFEWDIRFVLRFLGPRAVEGLWNKWINSRQSILVGLGLEGVGHIGLTRSAASLADYMFDSNNEAQHRISAGISLGEIAHERAAEALVSRIKHSRNFGPGFSWALSALWAFHNNWPIPDSTVQSILGEGGEVSRQLLYSMSVTGEASEQDVMQSLDSEDGYSRGTGALAAARLMGAKALPYLHGRDSESINELETVFFIAAQIHAGEHIRIDDLHGELQKLDSLPLLRKIWKRELLYSFFVVEGLDSRRGHLWCEATNTDPSSLINEMKTLLRIDEIQNYAESPKDQNESAAIKQKNSVKINHNTNKHVVFLLHGIRTQAEWQQKVANSIEQTGNYRVVPTRYEFLDIIRFLLPLDVIRNRPVHRITSLIRDEKRSAAKISVIAHSFGTYIVSRILADHPDIDFERVIFCGSIVKDDFPWERYGHRIKDNEQYGWQVLNDCGMSDIWPVFAKTVTWGFGSSGRFGFGHNRVKDRFFKKAHSDFFTKDFVESYWLPFLEEGIVSDGEIDRATTSWWVSLLTVLKVKYVLTALPLMIILYFVIK